MVFLSNYTRLLEGDFDIQYGRYGIVATKEKRAAYLSDDQVYYQLEADNVEAEDVLRTLLEQEDLPEDLRVFIDRRTRDIVGEEIEMFADADSLSAFCDDRDFAKHYGIENPVGVTLKVVGTFSTQKDFDASFEEDAQGRTAYGFWDMEKDRISCSFVYGHPIQTKMCFGDFGTSELRKGSLFLKMKVLER